MDAENEDLKKEPSHVLSQNILEEGGLALTPGTSKNLSENEVQAVNPGPSANLLEDKTAKDGGMPKMISEPVKYSPREEVVEIVAVTGMEGMKHLFIDEGIEGLGLRPVKSKLSKKLEEEIFFIANPANVDLRPLKNLPQKANIKKGKAPVKNLFIKDKKEGGVRRPNPRRNKDDAIYVLFAPSARLGHPKNRHQKEGGAAVEEVLPFKNLPQNQVMEKGRAVIEKSNEKKRSLDQKEQEGEPEDQPGPSKKRTEKEREPGEQPEPSEEEVEKEGEVPVAQPGPSRKRHLNEREQDRAEAKKPRNDNDLRPKRRGNELLPTEQLLFKGMTINHEKIRKQHIKITTLQAIVCKQADEYKKIKEWVQYLQEKINLTNEDLAHYKMTQDQ
ncbi:unnamed protein product [Chrysodeixis includens]|uniref:Uncharacterized protein n=1 Tax=Chrysodeixis includens TaxID=689277 RepID=A0A9P0BPM8_CHRIL|nr:unnamed protein product [Chrysodeixis includens]